MVNLLDDSRLGSGGCEPERFGPVADHVKSIMEGHIVNCLAVTELFFPRLVRMLRNAELMLGSHLI